MFLIKKNPVDDLLDLLFAVILNFVQNDQLTSCKRDLIVLQGGAEWTP